MITKCPACPVMYNATGMDPLWTPKEFLQGHEAVEWEFCQKHKDEITEDLPNDTAHFSKKEFSR